MGERLQTRETMLNRMTAPTLATELTFVADDIEQSMRNVALSGPDTRMAIKEPVYLAALLRRAASVVEQGERAGG